MEQNMTTQSSRAGTRNASEPTAGKDLLNHLKEWARDNPEAAAISVFACGFILGWRLKPW